MRTYFILFFMSITYLTVNAQPITKQWYMQPEIGLVNGDNQVNGIVAVHGGWQKQQWTVGLGTAVDYYQIRSAPIYVASQYSFSKQLHKSPFVSAKLGANIAWPTATEGKAIDFEGTRYTNFNNGYYAELNIGYQWRIGNQQYIKAMLGYSFKSLKEQYLETLPSILPFPLTQNVTTVRSWDYHFQRVQIGVAFQF
ncbi:MAG: hypothetical protein ACK4HE_03030 [Chitinophagaceae bacterium]